MVSRDDGKVVLWPVYFDAATPRPWRRVAKNVAVPAPTADEVARAAQALRLKAIVERDIPHPLGRERTGRVLLDARGSKTVLVRQVAEKLKEMRAAEPQAAAPAPKRK